MAVGLFPLYGECCFCLTRFSVVCLSTCFQLFGAYPLSEIAESHDGSMVNYLRSCQTLFLIIGLFYIPTSCVGRFLFPYLPVSISYFSPFPPFLLAPCGFAVLPQWQMKLSVFSCARWPFMCRLLGRLVFFKSFAHFYKWVICLFLSGMNKFLNPSEPISSLSNRLLLSK